jgi:hypothetical protein
MELLVNKMVEYLKTTDSNLTSEIVGDIAK